MAERDGVAGAAAELVAGLKEAIPAAPEPEQFDLLAFRPSGERLVNDEQVKAEVARTARSGPGRPKGAQNVGTRELKQFICTLLGGRTPVDVRARWLMLEPEELAKRLGCTKAEAFDRQDRIAADLSRYFIAPMAQTDAEGRAVPIMQLVFGNRTMGADGRAPWLDSFEPVEDAETVEPSP